MVEKKGLYVMNDKMQETKDYIKFWTKFSQKTEEILNEYNNLSDENKKRATFDAQRIFMMQGIAGVMEFGKSMSLKDI